MEHKIKRIIVGVLFVSIFFSAAILLYRSDKIYQDVFTETAPIKKTSKLYNTDIQTENSQDKQKVYFAKSEYPENKEIKTNIKYALKNAKIQYGNVNLSRLDKISNPEYSIVALSQNTLTESEISDLYYYIEKGGRVIFLQYILNIEDSKLKTITGIDKVGSYETNQGLDFKYDIYPGYSNVDDTDSDAFIYSTRAVELSKTTTRIIDSQNNPLIWMNSFGKGKVIYWNNVNINDKLKRGLAIQTMGIMMPSFVTGHAGLKVMHIDDFPAPIPGNETNVLDGKTKMPVAEFYEDYWWNDMYNTAKKYNIKYTGAIIGTYENKVENISEIFTTMKHTLIKYGRLLLNMNSELSVHGYNHEPLLLKDDPVDKALGYTPWTSQKAMEKGLTELKTTLKKIFSQTDIKTYVAPSNILSETGVDALNNVFPKLETIAGLYFGSKEQSNYVTEFEAHDRYKNIFLFPRTLSGYEFTGYNQYSLVDVSANMGVISHFIHPDDAFDLKRSNGLTWKELSSEYEKMQEFIKTRYPFMESYTQEEATKYLKEYLSGDFDVITKNNIITIYQHNMPIESSFVIRVEDNKEPVIKNGKAEIVKMNDNLWAINADIPVLEIELKER
ncbi:DUF2194 domain-containing protein [Mycoplasma sp. P36-A1]|uniref:DUF2194 domain-containing protein n=1 Tax=Mycoplasma sp. P36-A1 TaxID=3252900 RepID=UPI003C2C8135